MWQLIQTSSGLSRQRSHFIQRKLHGCRISMKVYACFGISRSRKLPNASTSSEGTPLSILETMTAETEIFPLTIFSEDRIRRVVVDVKWMSRYLIRHS